jgi:predicted amidohydrolase YtcJ
MDTKMVENRYPTRAEMDKAAPNHIMGIRHNNGHSWAVNSKALGFLDFLRETPGVEIDPATGEPTGVLRDQSGHQAANRLIGQLGPEVYSRCIDIIAKIAISAGATTIHCLDGSSVDGDPDVAAIMQRQDDIPHNFVLWYRTLDVEKVLGMGLPRIGGCLLIDGSPASHTGALFEPYSDKPSTSGTLYWQQEELDEWIFKAHNAGLQIAVHATCERAIEQILTAYERALTRAPRPDHRHRIEHFYFPRWQDIQKAARLGVGGGVQPAFEKAFREMYPMRLGPDRLRRIHPYRWHLNAGVMVGGGSDSQVTPVDPIAGIYAAVNHSLPEQRITPFEALRMFTVNNAWLGFEENDAGTLKIGKRGDMTVLSDDPLVVDPSAINEIKVGATIVRGKVVYEA